MKKFLLFLVVCLFSLMLIAQNKKIHGSFGLMGGSLNAPQSIAGAFSLHLGYDLFSTKSSSISLCTKFSIGTEDKTGLVFPAIIALLIISGYTNTTPTFNTSGSSGKSSNNINLFTEVPLMLHYNYGLGVKNDEDKRFGFYLGGGVSYMLTGFTDTAGISQSTSLWGYKIDCGIRLDRNLEISCGSTISMRKSIGQISFPAFYQLTIAKRF